MKWQLIGWVFLLFFYLTYKELIIGEDFGDYVDFLILIAINIALFYVNALWLLPKTFENKEQDIYKLILFLLLEMIALSIFLVLISLLFGGLTIDLSEYTSPVYIYNFFQIIFIHLVGSIFSVGYYGFSSMLSERKLKELNRLQNRELENQVKVFEQQWLKAQLPTHFLLNTLVMLRFTIKHEPATGAACLSLLSEILKYYTVDTTPDGKISLSSEIEQLTRYIALQELKLEKRLHLKIDIEGDCSRVQTLPMMVLLLAENIYKYGKLEDPTRPAELSVLIEEQQLLISAQNSINTHGTVVPSTGIGLKNLRERLAHFYPHSHSFLVENTGDRFKVEIRINL